MFISADEGLFKEHGVDASFKVVDTGTDIVNALHNGRSAGRRYQRHHRLKAVHASNPFQVIGLIMTNANNDHCDDPLATSPRRAPGINVSEIGDLDGETVGLATADSTIFHDGPTPAPA